MKTENEIQNILKEIRRNPMIERLQNKKRWYKVGKYLLQGRKIKLHQETKVSARRIYQYYSKIKGDWDRPSPRKLGKIRKEKILGSFQGTRRIREGNPVGIFGRNPKSREGRSCENETYDLSRKYGNTRRHVSATVWGS